MATQGSQSSPRSTARQPKDHLPPAGEPFIWPVGDEKVELPSFRSLMTFGRARRLRKLEPEDQMFTLLEEALDEKTLTQLDPLETDEIDAMFTAWQAHSGIDLGESLDSST